MRAIYLGFAVALCWTGVFGSSPSDRNLAERHRLASSNGPHRHRWASSNFAALGLRQATGQCGAQYGKCTGDLCCSEYGFCGDSADHCNPLFNCQPEYGSCGWPRTSSSAIPSTSAPPTSTRSSSSVPTSTSTSVGGTTTSASSTSDLPPTSTSSSGPAPTGGQQVTTDGRCGNSTICIGSSDFGPCCSQFFWCGSSVEFCGPGCQGDFGACLGNPGIPGNPPTNGTTTISSTTGSSTAGPTSSIPSTIEPPTTTSSEAPPTSTSSSPPEVSLPPGQTPSTDGRCGNGVNCLGSTYGRCCSQFGYCGDGDQFCPPIVGCQPDFGYCET
ncbi:hypothetical protein B0J18DRAFT_165629 [Chaetomium sp. MPI-SDFR-AT-0129]|nr:hypothetical protein B0J18DRAFT_165629 [Chaetomium sp. MPI-SDFR-AT-0129]